MRQQRATKRGAAGANSQVSINAGPARPGWARQARQARKGVTWFDVAVMDWHGRLGEARPGAAWHGWARQANKEQTKQ